MQPTIARAARLIQFVGPRKNIWKDSAPHVGKHPLEPANLEKHVAKANPKTEVQQTAATPSATSKAQSTGSSASVDFSQIPARYKRMTISDIEIEVIQSGGAF
ncbi:hypothetical protein BGW37DRAFT_503046 [Umbelopsis sp. PMI_123]|nr:hypothetical protein BGW37DRAFT_503046 [Umbelopsis sp. PMI_123]